MPTKLRIQISRRRNDDEDAQVRMTGLCTLIRMHCICRRGGDECVKRSDKVPRTRAAERESEVNFTVSACTSWKADMQTRLEIVSTQCSRGAGGHVLLRDILGRSDHKGQGHSHCGGLICRNDVTMCPLWFHLHSVRAGICQVCP